MKVMKVLRTLAIMAILITNVGCDQISKYIVRQQLEYTEQIGFFHNYFTLTKIENTGAFLSMGNTLPAPVRFILLTLLPSLALGLGLLYLFMKKNLTWSRITGLAFILGGGVGNIYDRIIHGSVTDFLHIDFVIFQTGIFNLADVSIMAGTFIILFDTYFTGRQAVVVDEVDHTIGQG
jgi:signal peptidase II